MSTSQSKPEADEAGSRSIVEFSSAPHRMIGLFGVLLIGLFIRLWGINWGLPSSTHFFSYHPDETTVLFYSTVGMNAFAGNLLPHYYNYGSLQLYLINFANDLAYLVNFVPKLPSSPAFFSQDTESWARMTLIGRLPAVVMGTWTVGLTYGIGTRLWNARAGLLAAALLAVVPLHAQHSHWLTVDVPTTFWIMLAVYWATRLTELHDAPIPVDAKGRLWLTLKPALWAGVAAGFATATKYNAVLVLLPVIHAALPLRRGRDGGPSIKQTSTWVAVALAACAVAFPIGCPGSVLDTPKFLHDVAFEAKHVGAQPDEPFQNTGSGFVFHITTNLYYGMGWPLLLVSLASLVYAAMRRQRQDGLLAVFAVPYYALIGFAVVRYARYAIPLLPFLALWSARMVDDMIRSPRTSVRRAGAILGVATLLSTLGFGMYFVAPMTGVDPRDRAVQWLNAQGLSNATIGFATMPWFYTPPVSPNFGWYQRGQWPQLPENPPGWQSQYAYHDKDWDSTVLDVDRPQVVLLSQYEYKDAIRLHRPAALAFLAKLQQNYRVGAEFGGYGRREIGPVGPPHDMMYANPATWVFVRK